MRARAALLALLAIALSVPGGSAQAPPKLGVSLQDGVLVVEGATANSRLVWFGVSIREAEDGIFERAQAGDVVDVGRDGTVRIDGETPFPNASLWLVIDLETGDAATRVPADSTALKATFRGKGVYKGLRGHDTIEERRHHGFLFVARPKAGAWTRAVGDGGSNDEDQRADGRVNLSVESLLPIADSPNPPLDLEVGDTVAFFDPYAFEFVVLKVKKS